MAKDHRDDADRRFLPPCWFVVGATVRPLTEDLDVRIIGVAAGLGAGVGDCPGQADRAMRSTPGAVGPTGSLGAGLRGLRGPVAGGQPGGPEFRMNRGESD
jgi:hypothetical protein